MYNADFFWRLSTLSMVTGVGNGEADRLISDRLSRESDSLTVVEGISSVRDTME